MTQPTLAQLERYFKHRWRKRGLLVADTPAEVREQGKVAVSFGYERMTGVWQSEATGEWYQWWQKGKSGEPTRT